MDLDLHYSSFITGHRDLTTVALASLLRDLLSLPSQACMVSLQGSTLANNSRRNMTTAMITMKE